MVEHLADPGHLRKVTPAMVPTIVPDTAHERHSHRRDKLADRLMAAGFVAVVLLSACTDVLGRAVDAAPTLTWPRASA